MTTRMMNSYLDQQSRQAIARATHKARVSGTAWAVVEMDSDDDFHDGQIRVVDLEFTTMDEFVAWDGAILAIVHPDGEVEY